MKKYIKSNVDKSSPIYDVIDNALAKAFDSLDADADIIRQFSEYQDFRDLAVHLVDRYNRYMAGK